MCSVCKCQHLTVDTFAMHGIDTHTAPSCKGADCIHSILLFKPPELVVGLGRLSLFLTDLQ